MYKKVFLMKKVIKAINVLNSSIAKSLFQVAFADEEDPTSTSTAPNVNLEDVIAQARKQEKDKLYPQIEKYKTKADSLSTKINEYIMDNADLRKQLDAANKKVTELEAGKNPEVEKELETLRKEKDKLEKDLAKALADVEGVRTQFELDSYKATKIAEAGGKIIAKLVTGTTKEEIDASIEEAKNEYIAIVGNANPQQQQSTRLPAAAGNTQSNSAVDPGLTQLKDVSKMSRAEYAEYRKSLPLFKK